MNPYILIAFAAGIGVLALLTLKMRIECIRDKREAHGERCRAEMLYNLIPDWDSAPILYYIETMHDENYVAVCGRYDSGKENDCSQDITIKKFPFTPGDSEDEDFAVREAEELKDKLLEK